VRIVAVSPRVGFPPRIGSSVRTHGLLRVLAERHEVRLFSQTRLRYARLCRTREDVRITGSFLERRYRDPLAALVTELSERTWLSAPALCGVALRLRRPQDLRRWLRSADVVLVAFPWQLAFCRRTSPAVPIVLDAHNVEATKFASYAAACGDPASARPWLRWIERVERAAVADADLVTAVSPEDRDALVARYGVDPARVVTIPNGADTARYRPVGRDASRAAKERLGLADRPVVVFVGADVPPNRVGLGWVRRTAAALPGATFLVVGAVAKPERRGNVVATGVVDDLRPVLAAADVALCPIEHGGGTKVKLLEAFAAGLPTVAFAAAVHGLRARDGEHVVVVDRDVAAIARALEALFADAPRAERLGRAAAALVARHYDWRTIGLALDDHLRRLVALPGRRVVRQAAGDRA
jgi:glycosyltransferase involved in cell wall biosynthesis